MDPEETRKLAKEQKQTVARELPQPPSRKKAPPPTPKREEKKAPKEKPIEPPREQIRSDVTLDDELGPPPPPPMEDFMDRDDMKKELTLFYEKNDPDKLQVIGRLCCCTSNDLRLNGRL